MIKYVNDDIFKYKNSVDALVNPVNCVGVMGKGLAKSFKDKYADNFRVYQQAYSMGKLKIGQMLLFHNGKSPKWIINFPTKDHWRNPSTIDMIEKGLVGLHKAIVYENIKSVAMPAIGCGLGGLRFESVRPLIEKELCIDDYDIIVCVK